ncbi:Aminolevulinate dehydratase [Recurvomyces mirabilis]|nr:Aminolevulinate dehydratase [Recurvomyces mirabilis]
MPGLVDSEYMEMGTVTAAEFSKQTVTTKAPNRLHSGYAHALTRSWQSESRLHKDQFVYPLFISDNAEDFISISSMPDQHRIGVDRLNDFVAPLVAKGLSSVILFGVINDNADKDAEGLYADCAGSPVIEAARLIRANFPSVYVIADVCLCEYTDHGHCGILKADNSLNNEASIRRLTEVAVRYAKAGAHCVAPSDMNDCRVAAIKDGLAKAGFGHQVAVMAYSAKFHSVLYGPFRDAAVSPPAFGDRRCYQLPCGARGLARKAVVRDLSEGADFVLVKPAGSYLDIIRDTKEIDPNAVVVAYQVSGEYAGIYAAANAGVADLRALAFESCEAMIRAGATVIISYFSPHFLDWLN